LSRIPRGAQRAAPRGAAARLALAVLLALAAAGGALAQDAAQAAAQGGAAPSSQALPQASQTLEPAAPNDGENPWARLGIVTIGSFPIMLFYTDFSFDLGAFALHGFDSIYAPWPFKSEYSVTLTQAEKGARIGVAIGASIAVGLIDLFIRSSKAKKARLQREALLELSAEQSAARQGGAESAPATGTAQGAAPGVVQGAAPGAAPKAIP
jgi:hypothetical protein